MRHAEGASVPADTAWTSVKTARVYTVSGLTNGALHSFEVRAVNGKTPRRRTGRDSPGDPERSAHRSTGPLRRSGRRRGRADLVGAADDGGSAIVRYEVRHAAGASVPANPSLPPRAAIG